MDDLEGLITSEKPWMDAQNLWVSSRYRYQDGWWTQNHEGKFVETDKPVENHCYLNFQCPPLEGVERCCMMYPDTNNRRCMPKAMHGIMRAVGPVTFTPTCAVEVLADMVPDNAEDDIAAGALAEASEALDNFYKRQVDDFKASTKYDEADAETKAKLGETISALRNRRLALFDDLKATIGYYDADCNDECKAVFEAELLVWEKQVYETCKVDQKGIACRESEAI